MKAIIYSIRLHEPLLVTALDGDPNLAAAYDFIPGSTLRGLAIGVYLRSRKQSSLNLEDEEVQRLFFNHSTRFLNGYIADVDGSRTLPASFSWMRDKNGPSDPCELEDFAMDETPSSLKQPVVLEPSFCSGMESRRILRPRRQLSIHTARNRDAGRAIPGSGAVYSCDAIATGQTFAAVVLCDEDVDADTIMKLLPGQHSLGGARTAGYGAISAENVRCVDTWRELPETLKCDSRTFAFTLSSDALLRNKHGHYSATADDVMDAIAEVLGCPVSISQESSAFLRTRLIGGFNRTWGLPLPQMQAIQMGSTFVCRADSDNLVKQFTLLEETGIGERRSEGFGRVVVASNRHPRFTAILIDPQPVGANARLESEESRRIAKRMVNRLFLARLDRRVTLLANRLRVMPRDVAQIAPSQLSRLRLKVRNELLKAQPSVQSIVNFKEQIMMREPARRQYDRTRIEGQTLADWLNRTLKWSESEWRSQFLVGQKPPSIADVEVDLTTSLRNEYTLRYIDAALARAVDIAQGNSRKGQAANANAPVV